MDPADLGDFDLRCLDVLQGDMAVWCLYRLRAAISGTLRIVYNLNGCCVSDDLMRASENVDAAIRTMESERRRAMDELFGAEGTFERLGYEVLDFENCVKVMRSLVGWDACGWADDMMDGEM